MEELKKLVATLDENMKENTEAVRDLRFSQSRLVVGFRQMRRAQGHTRRILAAIVLFALVLAFVVWRVWVIPNCINDNLGVRSGPNTRDSLSQIAFADLAAVGFTKIPPTKDQAAVINQAWHLGIKAGVLPTAEQFLTGLKLHAKTLTDDKAARDKNPPGKC